jgi:DNA-binding response OmpR family regulator
LFLLDGEHATSWLAGPYYADGGVVSAWTGLSPRCYPLQPGGSLSEVTDLLVVTDSPVVFEHVRSAVEGPGVSLRWARSGRDVLPALVERPADLVVADMQTGSMGALAVAMDMTLEAAAGRVPSAPVLVLLDRRPDVFLARRTGVAGWLLKPLGPIRTRAAVRALLDGERYEDPSFAPAAPDVLPA